MEDLQQLTLHVGAGIDAAHVSDLLLESFGAFSATVTDRLAGTSSEEVLCHAVDSTSLQNVLVDARLRTDVPVWTEAAITAYFPGTACLESVTMALASDFDLPLTAVDSGLVDEEFATRNWVAHVQRAFREVVIGDLRIRAPWHEAGDGSVREIVLDPGQAFGTGEHPTTQLIFRWILANETRSKGEWRVLDYGCGSGVLAIAAVLCGAKEAVGCDLDVKAVEVGQENVVANGVDVRIVSNEVEEEIFEREGRFEVVFANILASTLMQIAGLLCGRVKRDGVLVLSGILAEQAPAVACVFKKFGVLMVEAEVQAGWALLLGRLLA